MKRRQPLPMLQPIYVAPVLDRLQRAASRDWCHAAYRGDRRIPKAGDFDPLHLRMGLRASLIQARAGWVVSNPLYDQSLCACPANDPSLPGPGWLREVYVFHTRRLVCLPGVLAVIEARLAATHPPAPVAAPAPVAPPQLELFA